MNVVAFDTAAQLPAGVLGRGFSMTAGRSYSWWNAAARNKESARYFLDWLGDFDGDGISEIAIGRLPARTQEEAGRMVAKLATRR